MSMVSGEATVPTTGHSRVSLGHDSGQPPAIAWRCKSRGLFRHQILAYRYVSSPTHWECHVLVRVWVYMNQKGAQEGGWAAELPWTGWQTRSWHRPPASSTHRARGIPGPSSGSSHRYANIFTIRLRRATTRPGALSNQCGQTKPSTTQQRERKKVA